MSPSPASTYRVPSKDAATRVGLLGRKLGMMRLYSEEGQALAVTVVQAENNRIAQVKTPASDGYGAIQVAFGAAKPSRLTKAVAGHLAKSGAGAARAMREFRVSEKDIAQYAAGSALSVALFTPGQKVDVRGMTMGKGFAGTIKRHHFSSQRASHGNSRSHNVPGSISMAQDPGRVFPGKRMSGHLGASMRSVLGLEVARIDEQRQLLFLRGSVPGPKNSMLIVRPAIMSRPQRVPSGKAAEAKGEDKKADSAAAKDKSGAVQAKAKGA